MTLVDEEGSNKPRGCRAKAEKARDVIVVGQYTNDPPPVVNLADDGVEDDTQDCYVPTAEWCPNTGKKRKAKMIVQDDGLTNAVNTFCDSANERLGELSKKLFADFDEIEKRSSVYEAVGKVAGIDLNDQILLSDCLVENPKKMDLFFSLPGDARARTIHLMLDGKM
ncbi:hypothetical protein Salat_1684500 [Sesamum alatum]|uniref:Uncharacterized protein n=1 Tax=Sesamum alatum TaxID=300844 RepID=A0AAE2CK53_9LAMI|nr:hypothetical protein Salat_1684500 [Sesamum alatum]